MGLDFASKNNYHTLILTFKGENIDKMIKYMSDNHRLSYKYDFNLPKTELPVENGIIRAPHIFSELKFDYESKKYVARNLDINFGNLSLIPFSINYIYTDEFLKIWISGHSKKFINLYIKDNLIKENIEYDITVSTFDVLNEEMIFLSHEKYVNENGIFNHHVIERKTEGFTLEDFETVFFSVNKSTNFITAVESLLELKISQRKALEVVLKKIRELNINLNVEEFLTEMGEEVYDECIFNSKTKYMIKIRDSLIEFSHSRRKPNGILIDCKQLIDEHCEAFSKLTSLDSSEAKSLIPFFAFLLF